MVFVDTPPALQLSEGIRAGYIFMRNDQPTLDVFSPTPKRCPLQSLSLGTRGVEFLGYRCVTKLHGTNWTSLLHARLLLSFVQSLVGEQEVAFWRQRPPRICVDASRCR
jgi:hypothetical protein